MLRYTVGGVLFGALFTLIAWEIGLVQLDGGWSWAFVLQIHQQFPNTFVADLAPLVLGVAAALLARQRIAIVNALSLEREAARRDGLTGALNHGAIIETLRQVVADGIPCSVAMIDIDRLKHVNDTYGHQVGDELIIGIARILDRDGAIVGRYGGDEFLAIIPRGDRASGAGYRDAVLADLPSAAVSNRATEGLVQIGLSIGIVAYPTEASRVEDLIQIADRAMYDTFQSRSFHPDSLAARSRSGDPLARIIRDVVPLLTSKGDLQEKLQAVAVRVGDAAGYDAVDFQLSDPALGAKTHSTVSPASDDVIDDWKTQANLTPKNAIDATMASTHRPVIIDDLGTDQRITAAQRELLSATGLVTGLVAPMLWREEVIGTLAVGSRRSGAFGPRDADLVMTVATQVSALVHITHVVDELAASASQLREAHADAMMLLAAAAEAHDNVTGRHLERVRHVSEALARELGYTEADTRDLGLAAMLHDVGKIRVPESILRSTAGLDEDQWRVMKRHAAWGANFLADRPGFELAAIVAGAHHERWDGQGYPLGLAGGAIPEQASIVTVADSFDAITSDRPYREGRSPEDALAEIAACAGQQFNPRVVAALMRLHQRGLLDEHEPEERHLRLAA
jgi:diguanylate cyclase (GGDEF)-like protein